MSVEQTKIDAWYKEEWDGTLHGHMNWCIEGRTLFHELYLSLDGTKKPFPRDEDWEEGITN